MPQLTFEVLLYAAFVLNCSGNRASEHVIVGFEVNFPTHPVNHELRKEFIPIEILMKNDRPSEIGIESGIQRVSPGETRLIDDIRPVCCRAVSA